MRIEVLDVKDNGDGTTYLSFEADEEALLALLQSGLHSAIKYSVAECDCSENVVHADDFEI